MWAGNSNAHYRAILPMKAMEKRGHEVVWPTDRKAGTGNLAHLVGCDLVHVYRRCNRDTGRILSTLASEGTAVVWDNDDDLAALPKESPNYRLAGGVAAKRIFARTVAFAQKADLMTTPSEVIREQYRRAGVQQVRVISNYLAPNAIRKPRRHQGIVVGWVAGMEHQADAARLPIGHALRRLLSEHSEVRVHCIGVDLKLPERYTHESFVHLVELHRRTSGFDIGIAPLANLPFNLARSDIKLKEYAACGVPWLASPVGPYANLGEAHGGCLVDDDGWFEKLDLLVRSGRLRRRLSRKGRAWAKRETIDSAADEWEDVFTEVALEHRPGSAGARAADASGVRR